MTTELPIHPQEEIQMPDQQLRVAILRKGQGLLTWADDIIEGFHQNGAETLLLDIRNQTIPERWEQLCRGTRRFENMAGVRRISEELRKFRPDLLLILNFASLPKSAEKAFRSAMKEGTPVVGWLCDRIASLDPNTEPNLDAIYYFDSFSLEPLEKAYSSTSALLSYLPLAVCPKRYPAKPINIHDRKQRLVFAGNCTPDRIGAIADYRLIGGEIDTFGPHSGNRRPGQRGETLPPSELAAIYQEYAACFNLLQRGNTTFGLNMRAFEIPCAGGLAAYPDVLDLPRCFVPDKEVISYASHTELKEKLHELFKDPDRLLTITRAGHHRTLAEHTFSHRVATILRNSLPQAFPLPQDRHTPTQ